MKKEITKIADECKTSINDIINQHGITDDKDVYFILIEIEKWITTINNEIIQLNYLIDIQNKRNLNK